MKLKEFMRTIVALKSKLIKALFIYFPIIFLIIYGVLIINNTMSVTEFAEYVLYIYYSISIFLDGLIPINFIAGDVETIVSFTKPEEFIQMVNLNLPSMYSDILVESPLPYLRDGLLILKDSLPNPQNPKFWLAVMGCCICLLLVRWIFNRKTQTKSRSNFK